LVPYGLIADIHLHAWAAFATHDEHGVNSRLDILLNEIERVAKSVKEKGGTVVYIAGDLFHVRGSISPAVLNRARGRLWQITEDNGVVLVILAGNHDMQFRHSSDLGNAISAVACRTINVINTPMTIGRAHMIPWMENPQDVLEIAKKFPSAERVTHDLIIHAPINGTIPGIPNSGLDPIELAKLGFRRVFAGHYHNHKNFGGNVYSIGAIAHHTWSDVGSVAGHLIVGDDVLFQASDAPSFIDINANEDEVEVALRVHGNYVRAKTSSTKTAELNELREWLTKCGALGVLIQHVPEATVTRNHATATAASAATLEESVSGFIKGCGHFGDDARIARINTASQAILAKASLT
jgi:DNA repair exonuclease SbcCD nuclease subunit